MELGENLWPVIGILMTISCQVCGRNTMAIISNEYKYFYSYTMVRSVTVAVTQKLLKQQKASECVQREEGDGGTRREAGHLENNSVHLQTFTCIKLIIKCIIMSK